MNARPDVPTMGLPLVSPANMLPVQVVKRVEMASGVVSVFIVLPGTRQAPAPYLAGQFVTLALPTPRETLYRSYSLCGDGDASRPWELTIKRMEQGAVSTYFYQHVVEGTLLYSSLPRGNFALPADLRPDMVFVMCAAGSGITPIMGMLRAVALLPPAARPLVQLHYASRSERDIIFRDELAAMDPQGTWLQQWHYLSTDGARMTSERIIARAGSIAPKAHWYVCGPDSLKHDLNKRLTAVGLRQSQFHAEVFAAAPGRPAYRVAENEAEGDGGSMLIAETGAALDVRPEETVLVALERHGYHPAFSCRAGACGECKLKLLAGQVNPVGEALSQAERTEGYILSCIARPMGEITLASGGRPPAGVQRVAPEFAAAAGSAKRPAAVTGVRLLSLIGASALLLGSWNLTNHRPLSWDQPAQAAPAATATAPAGSSTATRGPKATATRKPGGGGGGGTQPTATPNPGGGGGGTQPTATPKPAPTATPKPVPTATCAKSPC